MSAVVQVLIVCGPLAVLVVAFAYSVGFDRGEAKQRLEHRLDKLERGQ